MKTWGELSHHPHVMPARFLLPHGISFVVLAIATIKEVSNGLGQPSTKVSRGYACAVFHERFGMQFRVQEPYFIMAKMFVFT
jgi:hypothetical protein